MKLKFEGNHCNMKRNIILLAICTCIFQYVCSQNKKDYHIHTIAFYNLENLFDTEDDPITYDEDRTPEGKDRWTEERYQQKLQNLSKVISDIGYDLTKTSPVVIGVAEIENRKVLEDLVNQPRLLSKDYGIVHRESPDKRGVDVGFLYNKSLFRPASVSTHELVIYDNQDLSRRRYTRDQLLVSGYLDGELIHIIVNHWPSRSGGEARSQFKREKAAKLNRKIIDSLFSVNPYAKIITMGDFNDDPDNNSLKKILKAKPDREQLSIKELYNPMYRIMKKGIGSLAYADGWNLFDQIIISEAFLKKDFSTYQYYKAGIYNKPYLSTQKGKYKGYPFRTYAGGTHTGGYSDHFPVYLYLIKEKEKSVNNK